MSVNKSVVLILFVVTALILVFDAIGLLLLRIMRTRSLNHDILPTLDDYSSEGFKPKNYDRSNAVVRTNKGESIRR